VTATLSQRSETGGCQGSGSFEIAVPTASYAIGIFQLFKKQELLVPSTPDHQKSSLIPHNHIKPRVLKMGPDLQRPDDHRGGHRSGRASRRRTRVPGPERSGGSRRGTCTCGTKQAQLRAPGGRMIQVQPADLTRGTDVTGTKRTPLLDVPMRSIRNERLRKSRIRSFWRPWRQTA